MSHYTLPKRYQIFLSVLLIITFDVKLNYFNSAIHLCGPTRLHCGATAFFEANIKLEKRCSFVSELGKSRTIGEDTDKHRR